MWNNMGYEEYNALLLKEQVLQNKFQIKPKRLENFKN